MAPARDLLEREHGRVRFSKTMLDVLELRSGQGSEGYAWQGEFRYGGDINRLALKSEGEGDFGGDLEQLEVQALYSRAVTPYFDLQFGVRQDFQPRPARTYATVAVQGLAPYWFDVEAALFLSHKGELSARFEGSYDLRLTQRLVLQPRAELNLAAQDTPALRIGAGLTDAEVGLRLRYEIRREFAPYIGLNYERRLGDTAALARAAESKAAATQVVVGVRAWF
jgi:copper resistance protein B